MNCSSTLARDGRPAIRSCALTDIMRRRVPALGIERVELRLEIVNRFPRKLVVCRERQIPIEPVRHYLIPREGRGADIRNLDVLLLSHQRYDQSRLGPEIYRLLGHRILHLRERSRRLQRDDARGHFRQIRRSDYEAARSICCWTSCSPFQIVGREPPTLANFMTFVVATLAFCNLNSRVRFCGFWLIDDSRFRSRTSKSSTHNPTHNLNGLV